MHAVGEVDDGKIICVMLTLRERISASGRDALDNSLLPVSAATNRSGYSLFSPISRCFGVDAFPSPRWTECGRKRTLLEMKKAFPECVLLMKP
jgi:hypothetical protein